MNKENRYRRWLLIFTGLLLLLAGIPAAGMVWMTDSAGEGPGDGLKKGPGIGPGIGPGDGPSEVTEVIGIPESVSAGTAGRNHHGGNDAGRWIIDFCTRQSQVRALRVPGISIDPAGLEPENEDQVQIRGSLSRAKGQIIRLYADDGKKVLQEIRAGSSGSREGFQLPVPAGYVRSAKVNGDGEITVFVQSRAAPGVAASTKKEVRISCRKLRQTQEIKAADRLTLTNLKTAVKLGAKASSGGKLTYRSSRPGIVSVSSSGKVTRKKNGKAVITISQSGSSQYLPATKKITVTSRRSNRKEQIDAAVAWAVRIANDDRFSYGTGRGAHHFGCYFCGTNYGPRKHMKPSARYKMTYCCNPFVSAAYAHGARHPKMLAACRRASGIGMQKWTFYRYRCWKCVGKPAYRKLQKGDVLVKSNHVAMYIGGHKLVEASGGTWSARSISVKHMSGSRYGSFRFVMRYTGY